MSDSLPQLGDNLALLDLVGHLLWLEVGKVMALTKSVPLLELDQILQEAVPLMQQLIVVESFL